MTFDLLRQEFQKLQEQMYRVYTAMDSLQSGNSRPAASSAPVVAPVVNQPASKPPPTQSSNPNTTTFKKIPLNKQIESLLAGSDKALRTKEIIVKLAESSGKTTKELRNSVSTTINLMKKAGRLIYQETDAGPRSGGYTLAPAKP